MYESRSVGRPGVSAPLPGLEGVNDGPLVRRPGFIRSFLGGAGQPETSFTLPRYVVPHLCAVVTQPVRRPSLWRYLP